MKAIVLSGGGSKGSYQIGVWKALRKLHIKYDIVTGTSSGAINAILMTQKTFYRGLNIWKSINQKVIFGEEVKECKTQKELYEMYGKNIIKNGGMSYEELEDVIKKNINLRKFFKSKIKFGIETVNLTEKKHIDITKDNIKPNELKDYVMASATCFPAFKLKDINGMKFVDGGYYDNLPINLAISLGATEIICVDLRAPGLKRITKNKKIPITTITSNNKLSNFLDFSNNGIRKNISYGYNDTMKVFNKLEGKKYTFKKGNIKKNINNYEYLYNTILKKILNTNKIESINKIINKLDIEEEKDNLKDHLFETIVENTGKQLNIDDTKIYNIKDYNKLLIKKVKNNQLNDIETKLLNKLKENKYDKLKKDILLNPIELLRVIYLFIIMEA